MSTRGKHAFSAVGLGGLLAFVGLAACTSMPATKEAQTPRIPAAPAAEVPALSVREVVAEAKVRLDNDDVPGALRMLNSVPPTLRRPAVRELQAGLRQDPWRAARFALALPPYEWRNAALEQAVGAMVDGDADAAIRWVIALSEPGPRFEAGQTVAKRLLEIDPRGAVTRLLAFPATEARDDLLRLVAAEWARREATKAVAWARDLPAGEFRTSVLTSVAFAVAQFEPAQALGLAEELPEGVGRRRVFAAAGQTWVARDADAAWAWARALPAGELRDAAIAGLETGLGARGGVSPLSASALGTSALVAPSDGLARRNRDPVSLPFGSERDRELQRKFEELLLLSPTMAANWVSTLPIPDRKEEMIDRVAREWLISNPAMAESWMDQNMVTPVRKEQLLRDTGLWPPAFPPDR